MTICHSEFISESYMDIEKILTSFNEDVSQLDIDKLFLKYLGKKGEVNSAFTELAKLDKEKRIKTSKRLNEIKKEITENIEILKENSKHLTSKKEDIDLSIPVEATRTGNLHPLTHVTRLMNDFFKYYGFSVLDGPEIEDDFHNFEMMGVPKDHPARDLQDTLYILEPEVLLRTQTSSVEARALQNYDPPLRVVVPGKVYRNETASKTNGAVFSQYQGFYVDKHVTMGNLKWIFERVLKYILGEETEIRFRSKFYPEVEPGMSPDIKCPFCKGTRCEICKYRGWIEIAGGGMIHPKTLEFAKIDHKNYSGFAFGFGLDRIAMAKFDIRDLRVFYNSSLTYR